MNRAEVIVKLIKIHEELGLIADVMEQSSEFHPLEHLAIEDGREELEAAIAEIRSHTSPAFARVAK